MSSADQTPDMVSVVVYDAETGDIRFSRLAHVKAIARLADPHLVVPEHRPDWDVTHKVVGHPDAPALAARPAEEAALRRGKSAFH